MDLINFVFAILLLIFTLKNFDQIQKLQDLIRILQKELNSLKQDQEELSPQPETNQNIDNTASIFNEFETKIQPSVVAKVEKKERPKQKIPSPSKFDESKQWFKSNWTGILGTASVIIGIGFLQSFLILNVSPFMRFLTMSCVAGLLLGGAYYIRVKYKEWNDFSCWLQCASGAVFLLLCLGSNLIEGLRFYDPQSMTGLYLLCFGVLSNLLIAWKNPLPYAVILGMAFNYLALLFAPFGLLVYSLSIFLTLCGYGIIWHRSMPSQYSSLNLIYVLFSIFRYNASFPESYMVASGALLSLLALILFAYQTMKEKRDLSTYSKSLPWINIIAFTVSILMWDPYPFYKSYIFGFTGVLCAYYGYVYKNTSHRWLQEVHQMATLIMVCLSSIFLIFDELSSLDNIIWITILAVLAGSRIFDKNQNILYSVLTRIITFGLVLISTYPSIYFNNIFVPSLLLMIGVGAITRIKTSNTVSDYLFNGYFSIFLLKACLASQALPLYGPVAVIISYLVARHLFSKHKQSESIFAVINMIIIGCNALYMGHIESDFMVKAALLVSGAVPILSLLSPHIHVNSCFTGHRLPYWMGGIAFYGVSALYVLFYDIAFYLPGALYLGMTALFLEGRRSLTNQSIKKAFQTGALLSFIAFICMHFTSHMVNTLYLFATVDISLLLAIIGIAIGLRGLFLSAQNIQEKAVTLNTPLSWMTNTGIFYELISVLTLSTIYTYTPTYIHIVFFSGFALGSVLLGKLSSMPLRIKTYGWVFYWLGCAHLALITSHIPDISSIQLQETNITGVIGLFLLLITSQLLLSQSQKEKGKLLEQDTLKAILPVSVATSLYFFWRFDSTYLTLIYFLICLLLTASGLYWRSPKIIKIAYTGFAACIVRLLFFDLYEQNMAVKALIFILSGLFMLGSQAIYKKFQHRLSSNHPPKKEVKRRAP